jgi:hypothetical protein
MDASALNDNTKYDDRAANEHAGFSAKGINGWTNEGKRYDSTNLVHGGHDTSLEAYVAHGEEVKEGFVGEERTEE